MDDESTILPSHIEETLRAIARLQASHDADATLLERLADRVTARLSRPGFVLLLFCAIAVWAAGNFLLHAVGLEAPDPPPFPWLQGAVSLMALFMTAVILASQARADTLASHREQLTLELAILGEQKTAKVIQLLEEGRRDNPFITDRVDAEADDMARPADPDAVLDAIRDDRQTDPAPPET